MKAALAILTRVIDLLESVNPSERSWVLRSLRTFLAASKNGTPSAQSSVHAPTLPQAQRQGQHQVHAQVVAFDSFWSNYVRFVP
jgi:hypothetical protein